MSQAYSDPKRASDPYSLPDVEVFHYSGASTSADEDDLFTGGPGWYWQSCFPGCLPDSDPVGPFETEADALADAQQDSDSE